MSFLDLCSNTIIIGFAFTILVSGIVVYLMNTKISRVEKNIQKQNQALAEAVNNIKTEVNSMPIMPPFMTGGFNEMSVAANDTLNASANAENVKITVSDDSDSGSDDDSDSSDSDSGSEDDSDTEVVETTASIMPSNDSMKTISLTVVADSGLNQENLSHETLQPNSKVVELNSSDSESVSDDSSDNDDDDDDNNVSDIKDVSKNTDSVNTDNISTVDTNSITEVQLNKVLDKVSEKIDIEEVSLDNSKSNEEKTTQQSTTSLTKMKVTELKDLAVDKNLATQETVADMKKKDLIELLRTSN